MQQALNGGNRVGEKRRSSSENVGAECDTQVGREGQWLVDFHLQGKEPLNGDNLESARSDTQVRLRPGILNDACLSKIMPAIG